MKSKYWLSRESFSANSDFDEKLVVIWSLLDVTPDIELLGTSTWLTGVPDGVISSIQIGWLTPKLPSTVLLLKTWGYVPPATAVTHVAFVYGATPQLGGSWVVPTVMLALVVQTLVETTRFPGVNVFAP